MDISEQNGQLCVELDTGSTFSEYIQYIESYNISNADQIPNKIEDSIHKQTAYPKVQVNQFMKGQRILTSKNNYVRSFSVPQPDASGYCNFNYGPSFLVNQPERTCITAFTSLEQGCSTVLNPQYNQMI